MSLRDQIEALRNERGELAAKQNDIITMCSEVKARMNSRKWGKSDFQNLHAILGAHNTELREVQSRQVRIAAEIRKLSMQLDAETKAEKDRVRAESPRWPDGVRALCALREEYQAFSADATRVASMRSMAAEFAMKLDKVIKDAVKASKEATA